jgi:hypothetical protein
MRKIYLCTLIVMGLSVAGLADKPPMRVPHAVDYVAEKAEDIIDYLQTGDWAKADTIVDSIASNRFAIDSLIQLNKMPQSSADIFDYLMFRLKAMIQSKADSIQAALAANQVTDLMIDLRINYQEAVPVQVNRLDYLGREIVFLAESANAADLINWRIKQLDHNWQEIRPDIINQGGADAAANMDDALKGLTSKLPSKNLVEIGNVILDLVDELEALYQ